MAVLWLPFPAQPWAGGAEQAADCLGHVFHLSLLPALIQTSLTSHSVCLKAALWAAAGILFRKPRAGCLHVPNPQPPE